MTLVEFVQDGPFQCNVLVGWPYDWGQQMRQRLLGLAGCLQRPPRPSGFRTALGSMRE